MESPNPEPVFPVVSTFRTCTCRSKGPPSLWGPCLVGSAVIPKVGFPVRGNNQCWKQIWGGQAAQSSSTECSQSLFADPVSLCSATNSAISPLLAARSRAPASIGIQGVTLFYLLWGHRVPHLEIGYYSSLDESQVKLAAGVHQGDFC